MSIEVKSLAFFQLLIVFCNIFITSLTSVKISLKEVMLQCTFKTFCNRDIDKFIYL